MHRRSPLTRLAPLVPLAPAAVALPVATLLAALAFAAGQGDALMRAESRYLGVTIAAAVAILSFLVTRGGRARLSRTALTAGLALVALWTVGAGTTRGAVCMTVLAAGLALAASERLRWEHARLPLAAAMPLAMAAQLFARPQLLLLPHLAPQRLLALLALPVLAAGSLVLMARRCGRRRTLIAGAMVLLSGPGFTIDTTLVLVALAGGALAGHTRDSGAVSGLLGSRGLLGAAASLLALPVAWQALAGGWPAAVAAAVAAGGLVWRRPAGSLGLAAVALLAAIGAGTHGGLAALGSTGLLALASLPATVRSRWAQGHRLLPALALLVLAARSANAPGVLGAALGALALALSAGGSSLRLQVWWTGAITVLASLLAAYPWVRQDPRGDALARFGLGQPQAVLVLVVLVAGGGLLLDQLRARQARRAWQTYTAVAGLATALVLAAPPSPLAVFSPETSLTAEHGGWERALVLGARAGSVVIESSLANSLALAPNAQLAHVRLLDKKRRPLVVWPLYNRRHSAEWAAERADVRAQMGDALPRPYCATVAADGSFFARRYRTRLVSKQPLGGVVQVAIQRREDLPSGVQLTLSRVEITR